MLDQYAIQKIIDLVIDYLPRLALAVITLIAGLWLIRLFVKFVGNVLTIRKVDESLRPFFKTLISIILRVLLLISVMGMIGIEMTSFIALLGAVGISIGMALSGSLQHFAGGVLLLIYKPFKKGDLIEAQGYTGNVRELRIFNTILNTLDNKTVFIPNGPLSTNVIVNYSIEETRRIDIAFSISYSDDIDKAKKILLEVIENDTRILKTPEPVIGVSALEESSVKIEIRVWVKNAEFLETGFYLREAVKKAFDKNGLTIPFPQVDVHMKSTKPE